MDAEHADRSRKSCCRSSNAAEVAHLAPKPDLDDGIELPCLNAVLRKRAAPRAELGRAVYFSASVE